MNQIVLKLNKFYVTSSLDKKIEGTSYPRRKANIKAYNRVYRGKNGPLKDGYVLESKILSTIGPYRPNIEFSKNS